MPRLIGLASVERELWSEEWVDRGAMLSAMADWLRRQPTTARMAFDEGWWQNRDLTLEHGLVRFDLQALVEDHGGGRCLCRLRVRSRFRAAAIPMLGAVVGLACLAAVHSMAWSLGVLAAAMVATHDAVVVWRLLSGALAALAGSFGLSTLGTGSRPADRRTAIGRALAALRAASIGVHSGADKHPSASGTC
jgi:hypothetical protein